MTAHYIALGALAPQVQAASYTEQIIPAYRGNPFIEALPPILCDRESIATLLSHKLEVTSEQRAMPSGLRRHILSSILKQYMYPLEQNLAFFSDFDELLRTAFIGRNPNDPNFGWHAPKPNEPMADALARVEAAPQTFGAVSCMAVLGHSGLGKTKMVEEAAARYPQVIVHTNLRGPVAFVHQLVWLKVSIPSDGSMRGFCILVLDEIDRRLGTKYRDKYGHGTVDTMTVDLARLACMHGIGVLIVDEIRNLRLAGAVGEDRMLNYFKQLGDVTRISIIAIGTDMAERVLGGDFQNARRNTACHVLQPLEKREFLYFCRGLLDGVVLRDDEAPEEAFFELLWNMSLGIHGLVVKLLEFTQKRALDLGEEKLTIDLLRSAYKKNFALLAPHLNYMRRAQDEAISNDIVTQHPRGLAAEQTASPHDEASVSVMRKRPRTKKAKIDQADPTYPFLSRNLPESVLVDLLREQDDLIDLAPESPAS